MTSIEWNRCWIAAFALSIAVSPAAADVATDGTVGQRLELAGPDFQVTDDLGRLEGRNLFHSFEWFSLAGGESATFSGPDQISNVISRVTGGERSDIEGTLRSTIEGAGFWFFNPAGVAFGPDAALDLKGSFHVSTADELRFADGSVLSADPEAGSAFTVAAPETFGFLGPDPAPIIVDGSTLELDSGTTLSLSGGGLDLRPGSSLRVDAGVVDLFSTGSRARFALGSSDPSLRAGRSIRLGDGAVIDASGDGGGTVRIRSGRFETAPESKVIASNTGAAPPTGAIDLDVGELILDSGLVLNHSWASGDAGPVHIDASTIMLQGSAVVSSGAFAQGNAGEITLVADRTVSIAGTLGVLANALSTADDGGDAGRIKIKAPEITLDGALLRVVTLGGGDAGTIIVEGNELSLSGGAKIDVGTFGGSMGDGGTAKVRLDGTFELVENTIPDGAITGVFARALGDAEGDAGNIDVRASALRAAGFTLITANGGGGRSGNVDLHVDSATLENGSQISASTRSLEVPEDPNGAVTVVAQDLVALRGAHPTRAGPDGNPLRSGIFNDALGNADSGGISISAPLLIVDGGRITSDTAATAHDDPTIIGRAGDIDIKAGRLEIRNEGQIFGGTDTAGAAGLISIESDSILIVGTRNAPPDALVTGSFTGIFSNVKEQGRGDGGQIVIYANELVMVDDARISNRTLGSGAGGDIMIVLDEAFVAEDGIVETAVVAQEGPQLPAGSATTAGDIRIDGGTITLRSAGRISSSSERGPGSAGRLQLSGASIVLDRAEMQTEGAIAQGGQIDLDAKGSLVFNQSLVSSNGNLAGKSTSVITIAAPLVAINSSGIFAVTEAGEALSGVVEIDAGQTIRSIDSVVEASSSVEISNLLQDFGQQLVVLPTVFLDAASLLREQCAARRNEELSSFTRVAGGGQPVHPDRPLLSDYDLDEGERAAGAEQAASAPNLVLRVACAPRP